MRPDERPALDLATETRVAHAGRGGFEVRYGADGVEVDLGGWVSWGVHRKVRWMGWGDEEGCTFL